MIATAADGANSVFAADVDGDGDLDVLSASSIDDKIAWYENTTGSGSLRRPAGDLDHRRRRRDRSSRRTWTGTATSTSSPRPTNDDKIAWYENTDGARQLRRRSRRSRTTADGARIGLRGGRGRRRRPRRALGLRARRHDRWYENTDGQRAASTLRPSGRLRDDRGPVDLASDLDGRRGRRTATSTPSRPTAGDDRLVRAERRRSTTSGSFGRRAARSRRPRTATRIRRRRGGRGRGRRPRRPLGLPRRRHDRLVREHGRPRAASGPARDLDDRRRRHVRLRGGRGRRRRPRRALGVVERRHDRLVRERRTARARFGPSRRSPPPPTAPVGVRGGRGRRRRPRRALRVAATTTRSPGTRTTDGQGSFDRQHLISTAADGATVRVRGGRGRRRRHRTCSRRPSDDDTIAWYENDGRPGQLRTPSRRSRPPPIARHVRVRGGRGRRRRPGRALGLRSSTTRSPGTRTRTASGTLRPRSSDHDAADGARSVFAADVDGDGDIGRALRVRATTTRSPGTRTTDGQGSFEPPARDHDRRRRGPLRLRGGRGRRRRPGRPLGLRERRQDRLVREHGRPGSFGPQQRDLDDRADGACVRLRGGRGRRRRPRRALGVVRRRQDRLVRATNGRICSIRR